MRDAPSTFRDRALGNICQYDFLLYLAFILEFVLLLFATIAFVFGDLDTAARTVSILNFVLLGVALAITIGLIQICNWRS